MQLKNSPKIFQNYKCDYPQNTIKRIEDGFKKLNIEISYREKIAERNGFRFYSGSALIFDFLTNGKGLTPELSKASAFAEMAERFCSGFSFPNFLSNSYLSKKVLSDDLVDKELLNNFYGHNYLDGHINISGAEINNWDFVKEFLIDFGRCFPLGLINDDDLNRFHFLDSWAKAYSLNKKNYRMMPISLLRHFSGSNGLAAGNTTEEAIVQGINEIFERHALIEVIKNKTEIPTIEETSIKDETIRRFFKFFREINVEVVVKDFTLGKNIPCIGVLFINNNLRDEKNLLKKDLCFRRIRVGAHLDKNQALLRCFTEEFQNLNVKEYMFRETLDALWNNWFVRMKKNYKPISGYVDLFTSYKYNSERLSFLEKGKKISFDSIFDYKSNDCLDEVNELIKICRKNNWEVFAIDHTVSPINFPVVRVIILPISFVTDFFSENKEATISDVMFRGKNNSLNRNLFYYTNNNDWVKSKDAIKNLINDLESYVSENLFEHFVNNWIDARKFDIINLLAFANLEIEEYEEAISYFDLLKEVYGQGNTVEGNGLSDAYGKISNFIKKNKILKSNRKGTKEGILEKMVKKVFKKRLDFYIENVSKCLGFFLLSSRRNPFSSICNNCDKKCGQKFFNDLNLWLEPFSSKVRR